MSALRSLADESALHTRVSGFQCRRFGHSPSLPHHSLNAGVPVGGQAVYALGLRTPASKATSSTATTTSDWVETDPRWFTTKPSLWRAPVLPTVHETATLVQSKYCAWVPATLAPSRPEPSTPWRQIQTRQIRPGIYLSCWLCVWGGEQGGIGPGRLRAYLHLSSCCPSRQEARRELRAVH